MMNMYLQELYEKVRNELEAIANHPATEDALSALSNLADDCEQWINKIEGETK